MTSAVGSTSNGKDLTPYWNPSVQEMSKKLWLPTKTALRDLVSTSSTGLPPASLQNSWFSKTLASVPSKNSLRTCFPSFTSFPTDFMASEVTVRLSRKIRIYPNISQRKILKKWMGTSRNFYNRSVAYLKELGAKAIRGEVKHKAIQEQEEWAKETPYAIRGDSALEACKTVSSVKLAVMKGISKFQETRFRSKKAAIQSMPIQKSAISKGSIYRTILGALRTSEPIKGTSDGRLTLENGRWFYCESEERQVSRPENQRLDAVAIDPGVRTFATIYSPEVTGKIGEGDSSHIFRLCIRLDDLLSRMSRANAKARYRMKKAEKRLRWRIKDLIAELHWKIARYLCETFKVIFLPTFNTSEMVGKISRRIGKQTVRKMLTLSHYTFKQRLQNMAKKLGSRVFDVNEAFTSKTCSACGTLHNIGSSKTLTCKCGNEIDRDINGARGIYLRALRDLSCTYEALA